MLSLMGAISISKWLVGYLGLTAHDYHVLIEWLIVVILMTLEEDLNGH